MYSQTRPVHHTTTRVIAFRSFSTVLQCKDFDFFTVLDSKTLRMAAILGGHYNDKDPIFLEESVSLRKKKRYVNICYFTLRWLVLLLTISLIMAACFSLYKYNKSLKRRFVIVDSGEFPNPGASSLQGELTATTKTTIQQIVKNYFNEGNVTEEDILTESRNETQSINLSGHAELKIDSEDNSPTYSQLALSPSLPPPPPASPPPLFADSSPLKNSPSLINAPDLTEPSSIANSSPPLVNSSPPLVNSSPPLVNSSPPLVNSSPPLSNSPPSLVNSPLSPPSPPSSPSLTSSSSLSDSSLSFKSSPPLVNSSPPLSNSPPSLVNSPPPPSSPSLTSSSSLADSSPPLNSSPPFANSTSPLSNPPPTLINSPPTPPPPPATSPPPPSSSPVKERESQGERVYHHNEHNDLETQNNVAKLNPRSEPSPDFNAYELVMGYVVRPVQQFVMSMVNRFLALFSG